MVRSGDHPARSDTGPVPMWARAGLHEGHGARRIHPTAVVSPGAELGEHVTVGPYAVLSDDVVIGEGTVIGPHVVVDRHTTIGRHNKIFAGAVVGTESQDRKYRDARSYCRIGDHNVIREYVTINRPTTPEAATLVGNHNSILAYCHVAHDCVVGDHVTISNLTTLAGHVTVGDSAGLGGYVGVHQFCRIGAMAYVGGWSKVVHDVPPFVKVAGAPLRVFGLNTVGLVRNGVSIRSRRALKTAYAVLYRSHLNVTQAIEALGRLPERCPELETLLAFLEQPGRGITRLLDEPGLDDGAGEDGTDDA